VKPRSQQALAPGKAPALLEGCFLASSLLGKGHRAGVLCARARDPHSAAPIAAALARANGLAVRLETRLQRFPKPSHAHEYKRFATNIVLRQGTIGEKLNDSHQTWSPS